MTRSLTMDKPDERNRLDAMRQGVIGKPLDRPDGPAKTTGTATYAAEYKVDGCVEGVIVTATISKGEVVEIDDASVTSMPGVIAVISDARMVARPAQGGAGKSPVRDVRKVEYWGQPIAVVIAETFEQARAAAQLVRVDYARSDGAFDLAAVAETGKPVAGFGGPPDTAVGDFAAAFASAPVKLDATYTTPDEAHAMMEPHASIAAWNGDRLTLWTSNQMIAWNAADLAKTLGMPRDKVRLDSPFIGGGFGGKLFLRADALLAALGARAAGRPVKVALQRPLIFNNTTHRPATIQRIRIGATKDGKITAIGHEGWSGNLPGGKPETAVNQTRLLYAGANRMTATRMAMLDLPEGNAMRAPGEAPGMMALEVAVDELAESLGIDPIELRILNDTQVDPEKPERRFSQRALTECLRTGAERFGWGARNAQPGRVRDGRWLVGMGVAAAFRNNLLTKSAARVRLDKSGVITVETDMTDIGTGSYTIIAQTAAEMMGVSIEQVRVRLGDSEFPVSAGSGGQWGANNATSGVYAACVKLRDAVTQKLGFNSAEASFSDGKVTAGNRSVPLAEAAGEDGLSAEDGIEYGDLDKTYQQSTFGAHFVEVGVDAATAEIRVRRMLAVCAAGRILNPKTARSQVIGAMTMGVGAALMEELVVDKRHGLFVNHDLAGYEVPVHADIPHQELIFLDETDPMSSPMKAKGVGELGICGVAAAVANAVYNATGIRVRDYPITLDKLLAQMPEPV